MSRRALDLTTTVNLKGVLPAHNLLRDNTYHGDLRYHTLDKLCNGCLKSVLYYFSKYKAPHCVVLVIPIPIYISVICIPAGLQLVLELRPIPVSVRVPSQGNRRSTTADWAGATTGADADATAGARASGKRTRRPSTTVADGDTGAGTEERHDV